MIRTTITYFLLTVTTQLRAQKQTEHLIKAGLDFNYVAYENMIIANLTIMLRP